MEKTQQGNQMPDTQQKDKPENAGQNQAANQQGAAQNQQGTAQHQQGTAQNQQGTAQSQQPGSREKGFTPSSPAYSSQQGEDEKEDNRHQEAGQGQVTSQRNDSGEENDQDRTHGRENSQNQPGAGQRPGTPGQDKGGNKGQQKS